MKRNIFAGLALAAAMLASSASANGLYTSGFPVLPAASVAGSESLPVDTNSTSGPQTQQITTSALKTYASGGAIITGTSSAGAVTANGERVFITTESLSTAAGAVFTEALTNSSITTASIVLCNVGLGTDTTGQPTVATVTPAAGSASIRVQNIHASAALNGTITLGCRVSN